MHRSPAPAAKKRSQSPPESAGKSSEVRSRTPLKHSEASNLEASDSEASNSEGTSSGDEPDNMSTPPATATPKVKAKAISSSAAPEAKQPSMPYFLQLTDHEIARKFFELTTRERGRIGEGMRSPTSKWNVCDTPECIVLDRYINIKPWASIRIKLQVPEGQNDYINASPICLEQPTNKSDNKFKYIAMQGPKQNTVSHTWRLIWEQVASPAVVVMLTGIEEGGREKCYQYFPTDADSPPLVVNEHDEFGDGFKATLTFSEEEETDQGDAIEVRKLIMRVESPVKGDAEKGEEDSVKVEEKVIWHLLYTRWPDFGVPAVSELDSFFALMELSRAKNSIPGNPRIVHCSAGVGRTGTFIALEHLIDELEAGAMIYYDREKPTPKPKGTASPKEIQTPAQEAAEALNEKDLVFETVDRLRQQRKYMVQADSQYQFIYRVLRRCWEVKYKGADSKPTEPEICQSIRQDCSSRNP